MKLLGYFPVLLLSTGALAQELPSGHPPIDSPQGQAAPAAGNLPPGHPPTAGGMAGASFEDMLKKLDATLDLKTREKSFESASAIGKLYYMSSRFSDAVEYLGQASAKADGLRALYLKAMKGQKKELPSAEQAGCVPSPQMGFEKINETAQAKAKAGELATAAACAKAALEEAADVDRLLANALLVLGDRAKALATHERLLELFPENPDARFGRAVVLLETKKDEVASLKKAKADLELMLAKSPAHPKAADAKKLDTWLAEAISAGGVSKAIAERVKNGVKAQPPVVNAAPPVAQGGGMPAPLDPNTVNVFQNTPHTPEMEAGLDKVLADSEELLAKGRFEEALAGFKQVMPYRSQSGQVQAGMAWSLVSLNKQPMADRVWSVAVANDPASLDKLGDLLKAKGNAEGAKALWTKLAASSPAYAQKLQAKLR